MTDLILRAIRYARAYKANWQIKKCKNIERKTVLFWAERNRFKYLNDPHRGHIMCDSTSCVY